jgi:hypothetical protein
MTDKKEIEKLIDAELAEANEKYPLFHSPHEAWAVLKEEVDELADDTETIQGWLYNMWRRVRNDLEVDNVVRFTYNFAINAACEAIQVAAMCKKFKQSGIE